MGILIRCLVIALLVAPWHALAWTLVSDNGTNHRGYEIIGYPWHHRTVESSGSKKGINYQYRIAIDDNESNPNTFKWAKRRSSPPQTDFGDNTTGMPLSASGNATIDEDYYFDLGNATGYSLGYNVTHTTANTGYLSISIPSLAKTSQDKTIKIRAIGDNDTKSSWVSFTFHRNADGNFIWDNETNVEASEEPTSLEINSHYGGGVR